jgi:hypothetical protein
VTETPRFFVQKIKTAGDGRYPKQPRKRRPRLNGELAACGRGRDGVAYRLEMEGFRRVHLARTNAAKDHVQPVEISRGEGQPPPRSFRNCAAKCLP